MDRNELAEILNILKIQPDSNKGFSLRRTLKNLHDYEQNKPIIDYYKQLINGRIDGDDG